MKHARFLTPEKIIFLLLAGLCMNACRTDPEKEKKWDQQIQHQPTGRIKASIVVARGVFKRKDQSCTSGFGLCSVQIFPYDQPAPMRDTLVARGKHENLATFTMNVRDEDEIIIEFMGEVPHWEDEFLVFLPETYNNIMGYRWIQPVEGIYRSDKSIGLFGGVKINITKGDPVQ